MPWLQGGRTVRGVIRGDSRPRDFIPRLVDLFMAGRVPLDRLITRYDFADINRATADATSGAVIKPVLRCRNDSAAGVFQNSDRNKKKQKIEVLKSRLYLCRLCTRLGKRGCTTCTTENRC
jgi:hypothetical protein